MVSISETLQRMNWVMDFLNHHPPAKLEEINQAWKKSRFSDFGRITISRDQWQNLFASIASLFGVLIEKVDKQSGPNVRYYIMNPEVYQQDQIKRWMLACIKHKTLLEDCLCINHRVQIDTFPSENGWLKQIVKAVKKNIIIRVEYMRYSGEMVIHEEAEPHYIVTYRNRLYALCRDSVGHFFISFDRIVSVAFTNRHFLPPKQTAREFLYYSFGVFLPPDGMKVQTILLKAKGDEQKYLDDVPLHHTQRKLYEEKGYTYYEVDIYPTPDFIGYIQQRHNRLMVVSPQNVYDMVRNRILEMCTEYDIPIASDTT